MTSQTTPVWIRPATSDDLQAINDIYNFYVLTSTATFDLEPVSVAARQEWFAGHDEHYPVTVAEADGAVVGWCSLSPFHTRPAYRTTVEDSIYVRDGWRRRGIGRLLLADMLTRAQRLGYHAVIARIGDTATVGSTGLHGALGFQHVGIEREVGHKFGQWRDVVIMQWLAPAAG